MLRSILLFVFMFPALVCAQQIEVSGNVSAADIPLLGVSVIEKGTTNGTTTDFKGNYAIRVNSGATLIFSYLGFATQELTVENNTLDVTLLEDTSQLDEVVVKGFENVVSKARRRSESVQTIPESVVTFTSQDIENKGITNVQSFADQIPNVNFTQSQNVGNNFITVRGISQIRNGDSPIAFVVDGVTLPDPNQVNQDLFDLALIEIVKGPQGALYGRNAIAGAINIVTNEPTNTFRNKIQTGFASGNLFQAQVSSTGPIVKDKFFYRVSGSYKSSDGLLDNITTNSSPDFIEDLSLRGQLKANFSSNTTATLTAQIIDTEAGAVYFAAPTTGNPTIDPDDFGNLAIQADQVGVGTLDVFYGNLKFDFNLGSVKLTSSSTYNRGERNHIGDLDFTPADVLRQIQDSNTETINQEFRLTPTNVDGKFNWTAGAFYQSQDKQLITDATADFGFFADPFTATGVQSRLAIGNFTNTFNSIAAFGFIDYEVSDRLKFSVGLRFDSDNIQQDNVTEGTNPERTDTQLQPKASVALNLSDDVLVYGNYGRGYRAGGFNQGDTPRYDTSFSNETTNNYEIGIKNTFWDGRFILNLAGYYIDFNNQQLYALVLDGGNGSILIGNFNVPESESIGFEADLKLRATNWLDILASYGLSRARITEGTSTFSTGNFESFDVSGNNTPLVPQSSFNFGLESSIELSRNIRFNGNLNLEGTGEIFWHEDNAASSSGYSLLNARLGFSFKNKFDISLWGTNILDQDYITEFFAQSFSNGGSDLAWLGQPATFGLNLSYKF